MKILTFLIISALTLSAAEGATFRLEANKGKVTFLAKGRPTLISIKGEGEGASGDIIEKDQALSGTIAFRLESLKTGIDLRDEHMKKKYLETEKHKEAILKFENVRLPNEGEPISLSGSLTLHGITQTIRITASMAKTGAERAVSAEFTVRLSQFKIEIPSFQGITVAEDVVVKFEAPMKEIP